jgi:hypothetical protein
VAEDSQRALFAAIIGAPTFPPAYPALRAVLGQHPTKPMTKSAALDSGLRVFSGLHHFKAVIRDYFGQQ